MVFGSFALFQNLDHLDLSNSNIEQIEEYSLDENRKLETVILRNNSLMEVPALFQSFENSLEGLTLKDNNVTSFNSINLENLLYLDLDSNHLNNEMAIQMLKNIPNLLHISLAENEITSIEKYSL